MLADLPQILELQGRAYRIFRWLNHALKWNRETLGGPHRDEPAEEARRWLLRNHLRVPEAERVEPAQLPTLANLFASFLVVSFQPQGGGRQIAGCDCGFCAVFAGDHFKLRALKKADRERAERFVMLTLAQLAEELGWPLRDEELRRFRREHALERELRLVTYGRDLLRRARFEASGPTGLVLWRELVPRGASPPRADDYFAAEQALVTALEAFAARLCE
jgi:hypothetical protein